MSADGNVAAAFLAGEVVHHFVGFGQGDFDFALALDEVGVFGFPIFVEDQKFIDGFVGFFFAAFVSVATTFLAEYLDPTFRTSAEVIEILNIPVVVSVPNQAA